MEVRKIDMDGTRFYLNAILATFSLVMEELEQEHQNAKGCEVSFYTRMNNVYMPAFDLVFCSIKDLLQKVEASV